MLRPSLDLRVLSYISLIVGAFLTTTRFGKRRAEAAGDRIPARWGPAAPACCGCSWRRLCCWGLAGIAARVLLGRLLRRYCGS